MKKILVLASMLCLLFSVPVFADEPETFTSGDYTYTILEDGTAEIMKYNGEATELEVPSELDGYAVTSIGEFAFECTSLTSITLPESVTGVGDYAFQGCTSLTSITLSESVTSIGDGAFWSCGSLSGIILPESITSIGANPFSHCDSISFNISPDHPYLAVIDNVLFSKRDKRLVYCPDGKEAYAVPEGITSIGECAFYGCYSLTSITLPESLTSIGVDAFSNCHSLSSITLPESVTSIEHAAFIGCTSLTSITLPESVTSIEYNAFTGCTSLTSITLPDCLTSIADYAFYSCTSLSSITLPESVTSIGDKAFDRCDNLSITVQRDSYAAQYCAENGLNYTYPDANDWLNS